MFDPIEIIEFNKQIEVVRGRNPMEVFRYGNCGTHHEILELAFGKDALPFHSKFFVNKDCSKIKHNPLIWAVKSDFTEIGHIITWIRNSYFDVGGRLKAVKDQYLRFLKEVPHGFQLGYAINDSLSVVHKLEETKKERLRMNNNKKLVQMLISRKRSGLKSPVDIKNELRYLDDPSF